VTANNLEPSFNLVITVTGSAVALHCIKAHRQSQSRIPNFNPLPVKFTPLNFQDQIPLT